MQVKLVQIGGSQGFRVPKALLAEMGEAKTFELSLENGALVFRPEKKSREGWAASFEGFGENAEEKEIATDLDYASDDEDWTW